MRRLIKVLLTAFLVVIALENQPGFVQAHSANTQKTIPLSACTSPNTGVGYSDVQNTDFFCRSLVRLADEGVIAGYPDGTFRPYIPVTRGEFSKILVKGFNMCCNTPGGPHFTDVPPGSTFYDWIETAYNAGIISGYSDYAHCGIYVPCFLPGAYLSRQQMAKMVTIPANYNDPTSGRAATYYDVVSGSTFFSFVENLVMHGIAFPITTSPPPPACSGVSSLPCFQPSANATRADIVAYVDRARQTAFDHGQVFAQKKGSFNGVSAWMSTPNPSVPPGHFVNGPVAVTDRSNGHFIESGPTKDASGLHPYGSWGNWYGGNEVVNTAVLSPAGNYAYSSLNFGGTGNQWQASWCDQFGCGGLVTSDDLGPTLPLVVTAAESSSRLVSVGTITSRYAQYLLGSSWVSFCYDSLLPPWKTAYPYTPFLNGTISPCNTSDFSWNITY